MVMGLFEVFARNGIPKISAQLQDSNSLKRSGKEYGTVPQ
jgi:hypothetical protein